MGKKARRVGGRREVEVERISQENDRRSGSVAKA